MEKTNKTIKKTTKGCTKGIECYIFENMHWLGRIVRYYRAGKSIWFMNREMDSGLNYPGMGDQNGEIEFCSVQCAKRWIEREGINVPTPSKFEYSWEIDNVGDGDLGWTKIGQHQKKNWKEYNRKRINGNSTIEELFDAFPELMEKAKGIKLEVTAWENDHKEIEVIGKCQCGNNALFCCEVRGIPSGIPSIICFGCMKIFKLSEIQKKSIRKQIHEKFGKEILEGEFSTNHKGECCKYCKHIERKTMTCYNFSNTPSKKRYMNHGDWCKNYENGE